jgi:hypothetical protein
MPSVIVNKNNDIIDLTATQFGAGAALRGSKGSPAYLTNPDIPRMPTGSTATKVHRARKRVQMNLEPRRTGNHNQAGYLANATKPS